MDSLPNLQFQTNSFMSMQMLPHNLQITYVTLNGGLGQETKRHENAISQNPRLGGDMKPRFSKFLKRNTAVYKKSNQIQAAEVLYMHCACVSFGCSAWFWLLVLTVSGASGSSARWLVHFDCWTRQLPCPDVCCVTDMLIRSIVTVECDSSPSPKPPKSGSAHFCLCPHHTNTNMTVIPNSFPHLLKCAFSWLCDLMPIYQCGCQKQPFCFGRVCTSACVSYITNW
jgi:hypothetical protein